MHPTAMSNGKLFFDTYVARLGSVTVVDIGAQDVNGSLREVCPPNASYIGVDFERAKGVDVVLTDPYVLPFENESVDVVVSSSCFEHSEMFWLVFNEVLRILKPSGLFYLNVPSNGAFHRYPVDCWRFYPDSGKALVTWAQRCGINAELLESFTSRQHLDVWNDFVAIFVKDKRMAQGHPDRMISVHESFENGCLLGHSEILNMTMMPEDFRHSEALQAKLAEQTNRTDSLSQELASSQANVRSAHEQLEESRAHIEALQREAGALAQVIHDLENSTSWRVTAPLRALRRWVS